MTTEGVLEAAGYALAKEQVSYLFEGTESALRRILLATIQWLAENLVQPTAIELKETVSDGWNSTTYERTFTASALSKILTEWQSRMFIAPISYDITDLVDLFVEPVTGAINGNQMNDRIRQAYNRGKNRRDKNEADLR